jgi:hypothetical protein
MGVREGVVAATAIADRMSRASHRILEVHRDFMGPSSRFIANCG